MIYGVGMFEAGLTLDYGQMVMDDELAAMVKHVLRGIPVNDETLALDVIHEIGSFKEYLSHDHTYRHMHVEQTQPELADRRTRDAWEKAGSRTIHDSAWEKANHILDTHRPDPLPDDVLTTIRSIVEEAEAELGISSKR